MKRATLSELNLLALPSLDLLSTDGFGVVDQLPSQPGCYAVVCTVAKRLRLFPSAQQQAEARAIASILGSSAKVVVKATELGRQVSIILYIGYSKNMRKRWAGRTEHHKQADLNLTSHLLNSAFDMTACRLHFFRAPTGEQARQIEGHLISQWKPILNGRSPLVRKEQAARIQ